DGDAAITSGDELFPFGAPPDVGDGRRLIGISADEFPALVPEAQLLAGRRDEPIAARVPGDAFNPGRSGLERREFAAIAGLPQTNLAILSRAGVDAPARLPAQ